MDEKVNDRWSRYIGAMGKDAVAKQAESRVLLCELGALGVEIAKNIVLAGCKELVIFEKPKAYADFAIDIAGGQFFLPSDAGGESRASACWHKLQALNQYVRVTVVREEKYPNLLAYL